MPERLAFIYSLNRHKANSLVLLDTNYFKLRAVMPQSITCRNVVTPERCRRRDAQSNLWTPGIAATKLAVAGASPPSFLSYFYRQRNLSAIQCPIAVTPPLFCVFGRLSSFELIVVSRPVAFTVVVFLGSLATRLSIFCVRRLSVPYAARSKPGSFTHVSIRPFYVVQARLCTRQ